MRLENGTVRLVFVGERRLNKGDDFRGQGAPKEVSTALQNLFQFIIDVDSNTLHFTP